MKAAQEKAGGGLQKNEVGGGMREQMPESARLVDQLREQMGREWVDAALREGIRLQRQHADRRARHGQARADAWLAAQRPAGASLRLLEAGLQVGELPTRGVQP